MKRIFVFVFLLVGCTKGWCAAPAADVVEPMPLDAVAEWIQSHVRFPQEAVVEGLCGVERFSISAAWDGRVFIASQLITLQPAFEQELLRVVNAAPRSYIATPHAKDLYQQVTVDFAALAAADVSQSRLVGAYLPPWFPEQGGTLDIRKRFAEWVGDNFSIPQTWAGRAYEGSFAISYRVTAEGGVDCVRVEGCNDEVIRAGIEQTIARSPRWRPARTEYTQPLDMMVCDTITLRFDERGAKQPVTVHVDIAQRNADTPPADTEMLVLNPEVKPRYQGQESFIRDLKRALSKWRQPVDIVGVLIIEKDGSVSGLEQPTPEDKTGRALLEFLRQSRWTPASQGGVAVRTLYSFRLLNAPKRSSRQRSTEYDIYGKHYIYLNTSPHNASRSYIDANGQIYNYPFTRLGGFDYNEYNRAMIEAAKHKPQGKNASRDYFNRIARDYTR